MFLPYVYTSAFAIKYVTVSLFKTRSHLIFIPSDQVLVLNTDIIQFDLMVGKTNISWWRKFSCISILNNYYFTFCFGWNSWQKFLSLGRKLLSGGKDRPHHTNFLFLFFCFEWKWKKSYNTKQLSDFCSWCVCLQKP